MNPISIASSLPSHWREVRFRYIAATSKGRLPTKEEEDVAVDALPYLSMEYLRGDTEASQYVPAQGMLTAENNDVLLLWDGSNAGEFLKAKRGAVSSTTALVTPLQFDRQFLFWICKAVEPVLKTFTNGMGIPHVDGEFLKNLALPCPTNPDEQSRIAIYLDREIARIDGLIAEKELMLALLEEKRAALISRFVTRGLDQNVPLKPSCQEWLGEIPAHWRVERAKNLFMVRDERSDDGSEELLTVSHITGVTSRSEKDVYMFEADDKAGYKRCMPGDLAINTLWAWMGAMGISPLAGIVSPDYHVYTSKGELLPEYVDLLCRSLPFVAEVSRWSKGVWSSRLRLYPENFFEMRLPVPPHDEQAAIVRAVKVDQRKANALRESLQLSITLANERRAALITAAVIGQIPLQEMTE
ncbi:restriction endonuclease subunit S [Methylobacillus glycogenes]|uniref:restriction endonuclease subunit S n=1 Tax=Methylobacillus glycogenes TaxID=406 RepID=UPI00047107E9|nr:restriction endonuclease subunit S [Methylobacillus glycogenes]